VTPAGKGENTHLVYTLVFDWAVSSSCFGRRKFSSVRVATMPRSTAVAVERLAKSSIAPSERSSSACCATAALAYPEAAAVSTCICLCWQ
jgi:hypothetical protein